MEIYDENSPGVVRPETVTAFNDSVEKNKELLQALAEPEPRKPTRVEIGKARRYYLTVVHDTVSACGHKFKKDHVPVLNCDYCWRAFFKTVADLQHLQELLQEDGGIGKMKKLYGDKVVKNFRRFLYLELTKGYDGISEEAASPSGTEGNEDGSTEQPSGEIQGSFQAVGSAGQEARNDEQPNAPGQPSGTESAININGTPDIR
jgi:hypothetical protein